MEPMVSLKDPETASKYLLAGFKYTDLVLMLSSDFCWLEHIRAAG
jgi:hypothetical protein